MTKGPVAAMTLPVGLCLGVALDGSAEEFKTRGWVLAVDLGATAVSFQNAPSDRGGIVGARVGYGLNGVLTPYAGMYDADVDVRELDGLDKLTWGHVDLGVRLHLADRRRRWVPYADVALTFWFLDGAPQEGTRASFDPDAASTFSLGGGLALYLSEAWALDVNLKWGRGRFSDARLGATSVGRAGGSSHRSSDLDATSIRFTAGVSWWP